MDKTLPSDACRYFNEAMETLDRPQIEALQLKRLQATVHRCMNSPFYKERFEQAGLKPEDIRSLDDLRRIPFTTKKDLRDLSRHGTRYADYIQTGNSTLWERAKNVQPYKRSLTAMA